MNFNAHWTHNIMAIRKPREREGYDRWNHVKQPFSFPIAYAFMHMAFFSVYLHHWVEKSHHYAFV